MRPLAQVLMSLMDKLTALLTVVVSPENQAQHDAEVALLDLRKNPGDQTFSICFTVDPYHDVVPRELCLDLQAPAAGFQLLASRPPSGTVRSSRRRLARQGSTAS